MKRRKKKINMAKQKQNIKEQKLIHNTIWGFELRRGRHGEIFWSIIMFAVFLEFLIISCILLVIKAINLGVIANYLIGAFLSLEICFIIFNIYFKKKATVWNVLGYKALAFIWGVSIYNLVLILAIDYSKWQYLLMKLLEILADVFKYLCFAVGVLAIVAAYVLINWLVTKAIEGKGNK